MRPIAKHGLTIVKKGNRKKSTMKPTVFIMDKRAFNEWYKF